MNSKFDNFERAFSDSSGGLVRTCECGKAFYNDEGRDFEEGEYERLLASPDAVSLDHDASTLSFEGKTFVMDCDCWKPRAEVIMRYLDGHAFHIAEYLTLEKKRKQDDATYSPTVR